MSPARFTCVPPHSSVEKSPIDSTRTRLSYFSPNSAIAPRRDRLLVIHHARRRLGIGPDLVIDQLLDLRSSARGVTGW